MITKKTLIIEKYLKMNEDIKIYINQNIFPEFNNVIDILFYFNYHFIKPNDDVQTVDDILFISNVSLMSLSISMASSKFCSLPFGSYVSSFLVKRILMLSYCLNNCHKNFDNPDIE